MTPILAPEPCAAWSPNHTLDDARERRVRDSCRFRIYVDFYINVERAIILRAQELKKWLAAEGCTFESKKGGLDHLIVRRGDRKSELPMHGGRKELGTGLVNAIEKQLGLK